MKEKGVLSSIKREGKKNDIVNNKVKLKGGEFFNYDVKELSIAKVNNM